MELVGTIRPKHRIRADEERCPVMPGMTGHSGPDGGPECRRRRLSRVLRGGDAELLFEGGGEVGEGVEAGHPGDFGHVVLAFLQEVGGAVELVAL